MRDYRRNQILIGLLSMLSFAVPAMAQVQTEGCALQGIGPNGAEGFVMSRSSGNNVLDEEMTENLHSLASLFGVHPRLYFFDDGLSPNALAHPKTLGDLNDFPPERNPFGTMLFGVKIIETELRSTPQNAPRNYTITAIIAHELGHILQNVKKAEMTNPQKELQSDFLAGWAIKFLQRNGDPDIDEADVFTSFYKKGDYAFNSPQHHGTKTQRLAAFLAGYEVEDNDANVAFYKALCFVRGQQPDQSIRAIKNDVFAKSLGAFYEPIPNPDGIDGAFALKISRDPAPDTRAARAGIEKGDIILALDELPFRSKEDVLNHFDQTTVLSIDVRTKARQQLVITLPPQKNQ